MKVICISGTTKNVDNYNGLIELTFGKEYEVVEFDVRIQSEYYKIINDLGYLSYYNKNRFKTISEIRIEKLKKIK
jgi:hypothetical protein